MAISNRTRNDNANRNNMDHFGEDAWRTYKAGHTIALRKAKAGTRNPEKLKEAYMYDAFALHYLTDQFASGHVRSPREALNQPSTLGVFPTK